MMLIYPVKSLFTTTGCKDGISTEHLVANVISAEYYYQKAAEVISARSTYCAANKTKDAINSISLSQEAAQRAGCFVFVQRFSEVTVLLLIVVTFVVVGVLCMRCFRDTCCYPWPLHVGSCTCLAAKEAMQQLAPQCVSRCSAQSCLYQRSLLHNDS